MGLESSPSSEMPSEVLLLKNLRIVGYGPDRGSRDDAQTYDVKIFGGRFQEISRSEAQPPLDQSQMKPVQVSDRVVDFGGAYASAGWIDLHTHVFDGIGRLSVPPDEIGLSAGVHLCADAGTAGEATFGGFVRHIVHKVTTKVVAYINISAIGLLGTSLSEFVQLESVVDCDRLAEAVNRHRDVIRAIKVRTSSSIVGKYGLEPLRVASSCARRLRLPLFVHIGEEPPCLDDVLDLLDPGDVITHCFHGKDGGWTKRAALVDAVKAAVARGVLLDLGHGGASFSFAVARKALSEGIPPYSISTDLHARSKSLVVSLAMTMSKMLALGMSLEEVIVCVTDHPARWLHETEIGFIKIGASANLTIFALEDGEFEFFDSMHESILGTKLIIPIATVIGNKVRRCSPGSRPGLARVGNR